MLRKQGFQTILEAVQAPEAIAIMKEELVDLVLTHWTVEDYSGEKLLAALRKCGRKENIPVVLLDEGLPQSSIVAAVKAGIAGRLPLPPEAARLNEILCTIREFQSSLEPTKIPTRG